VISVHEAEVRVAFSTTGRHAVTASADGFVRVIDLASGAAVAEHRIDLGDADNSIDELGVDEAANPWVRSTDDLWPLPPARTPPAKPPRAFSMQIKDGRGRLELKSSPWDVLASSEWMPFPEEDYCNVLGEVLHHDGDATRYIVHRESHPVQTWERQGDRLTLVGDFCPPLPDDVEPDELRLCPQRRHLLTKYWADPIHVRRLPPDRRAGWRQVNTGHFGWFKMSDFDATGQVVLTHSWDRSLRVTDIDAGRPIHVLAGHGGPIVSSCFSPDGRWVLSGSMDKTARLWKLGM
jgi:WD40 repeat protein